MKKCVALLIFSLIYLFGSNLIFAQDASSPSENADLPLRNTIDFYYGIIGEKSQLYTGSQYVSPVYQLNRHPFFISFYLAVGSIYYNGLCYPAVLMSYDILNDRIVINRYNQNFRIQLANDKIDSFSLLNHFFVRIGPDTASSQNIEIGFYDRLYDGNLKVYSRRSKKSIETMEYNVSNIIIVEDDHYFIEKKKIFYPIKNKKAFFSAFDDKKKEIRKYLRTNKIKFRTSPEKAIVMASEYFDTLKK
jgi:hypothetical protein